MRIEIIQSLNLNNIRVIMPRQRHATVSIVQGGQTLGSTLQIGSFLFHVALPKVDAKCIEIIVNYDLCGRVLLSPTV